MLRGKGPYWFLVPHALRTWGRDQLCRVPIRLLQVDKLRIACKGLRQQALDWQILCVWGFAYPKASPRGKRSGRTEEVSIRYSPGNMSGNGPRSPHLELTLPGVCRLGIADAL